MQMDGKTHENIKTIRPLRDGVIADFDMANDMIRELIKMMNLRKTIVPPSLRMVICIPSGITNVEERAVRDAARVKQEQKMFVLFTSQWRRNRYRY